MYFDVDTGAGRIQTTIAKNHIEVEEGIKALMSNTSNHKRLIGLDTIARQKSSRTASLDFLQLCDESKCILIKVNDNTIPESLFNFLSLPTFTFVGFGIKDTLSVLKQEYGIVCKNYLEAGYSETRRSLSSVNDVVRTMYMPHYISHLAGLELVKLAVCNAHTAFRIGQDLLINP